MNTEITSGAITRAVPQPTFGAEVKEKINKTRATKNTTLTLFFFKNDNFLPVSNDTPTMSSDLTVALWFVAGRGGMRKKQASPMGTATMVVNQNNQ